MLFSFVQARNKSDRHNHICLERCADHTPSALQDHTNLLATVVAQQQSLPAQDHFLRKQPAVPAEHHEQMDQARQDSAKKFDFFLRRLQFARREISLADGTLCHRPPAEKARTWHTQIQPTQAAGMPTTKPMFHARRFIRDGDHCLRYFSSVST